MVRLFSPAWWCTWVYPTTEHPGVDLKFVFCTMGKLDVNKDTHREGDALRGDLGSVLGSPRRKTWLSSQDSVFSYPLFESPFSNNSIECWLYADIVYSMEVTGMNERKMVLA